MLGIKLKIPPGYFKTTGPAQVICLFLLLFIAITSDLNVSQVSIPDFEHLQVHEGVLGVSRGRRNAYMFLKSGREKFKFACRVSSSIVIKCLNKKQREPYIGEVVKVYFYEGIINGIGHENRLLQLEVDGKVIISYEDQKEKYYLAKERHTYSSTWIFFLTAIVMVIIRKIRS